LEGFLDFNQLQTEQKEWQNKNFPNSGIHQCFYGVVEELGELAHALLKMDQGIRGTQEEHMSAVKDAISDIVIYLAGLCNQREIDFQKVVEKTWNEVKQRDWIKYPFNGIDQ
jgi:NTP pyrophosphatase (non-canonical NTP hydrolase)